MPKRWTRSLHGLTSPRGWRRRDRTSPPRRAPRSRDIPAAPRVSCTGSLTTAPTIFAARLCASISPAPKWPASAQAPMPTEMASAVDSEPDGGLQLQLAVERLAVAQLAEDASRRGRSPCRPARSAAATGSLPISPHALDDDRRFLLRRGRQRQHDHVEAPLERRGQLVDALVAVVGGGDDVEAALRIARPRSSSGIGSVFSDSTVISVSCTSEPMRVSSSRRTIVAVLHGAHQRRRRPAPRATDLARAAAHSSSRSGSGSRRCRPCTG